jgi:transposase
LLIASGSKIDVGLEHFATIASDEGIKEIKNPCFFRKSLLKIRYLGRKLSKKRLKSENLWKADDYFPGDF